MKFSTRELVILAVFGGLWGLVETSLGTALKATRVPMSGLILASIGLFLALIARALVPRRGSTVFIGAIAVLLKLFSVGSILLGPIVGILSEAMVAEIVLSLAGRPRRPVLMLAGGLGVLWVLVQPFVTNPLFFGRTVLDAWAGLLKQGVTLLGIDSSAIVIILVTLVALYLAAGLLVGRLAWNTSAALLTRLGRTTPGMTEASLGRGSR